MELKSFYPITMNKSWYGSTLEFRTYMSAKERAAVTKARQDRIEYYEQNSLVKTLRTMSDEKKKQLEKEYNCKILTDN